MKWNFKAHLSHHLAVLTVLDDDPSSRRLSSVSMFSLPRMLHLPSPPPPPPPPRLLVSGEQRSERQLHLLAALHPRGVSQGVTGGSERDGGQHHLTFAEEHPQTALPLQGQPSSPPHIPRATSFHRSPTRVPVMLAGRSKLRCRLRFRTETRRRRPPRGKEKRAPCEAFPSNRWVD